MRTRVAAVCLGLLACSPHAPETPLPQRMLWAWERPEDLSFLDGNEAGVAFHAGNLLVESDGVLAQPRLWKLALPPGIATIAVVHMQDRPGARLTPARVKDAVAGIIQLTGTRPVSGVQVDFDAVSSERAAYRELLLALRRALPEGQLLSITALASWCMFDGWMKGLPVDEVVPMLVTPGAEYRQLFPLLDGGGDFRLAQCRQAVGVSAHEPVPRFRVPRRVYVFSPRAWTAAGWAQARRLLGDSP